MERIPNYSEYFNFLVEKSIIPEIYDFKSELNIANETTPVDVSSNIAPEDYLWGFSSYNNYNKDEQRFSKLNSEKDNFVENLLNVDFDNLDDNELVDFTKNQLKTNKIVFLTWLETLFYENQRNDKFILNLIDLLCCFSFEEVQPQAVSIALACKCIKSNIVQSKNLSLLGHWCNKSALNIITNFEEPKR